MRRFLVIPALILLLVGSVILSQSTVKNPHGQLKWDCQDCHTTDSWSQMRDSLGFDHASTGFTLVGAHATAQCTGCHKDPVFSHVGASCIDCHSDQHNGQLGTECQSCHTPRDWQNRKNTLELHAANGFALTGAHAVADCESCHRGHAQQEYAGTPMECYDCHSADYAATEEPNHASAGFPLDCQSCHEAALGSWRYADFNHPASFPLTGGHQGVACITCHPNGYPGTSSDCYSCHATEFASTVNPDHETSGFDHQCTLCHTINGWTPTSYNHNETNFPLTGAHLQTACVACHATQYAGTPTACFACHQTDYNQTTEPDHQLAAFDQNCLTCHTTSSWQPSSFDHATTGFALTGQHTTLVCSSCHGSSFSGTPTGCYNCHQADFESVTDPNHVAQGFSQNCTVCHNTSGWSPSSFNHGNTAFPLTGKHVDASCTSCHTSGYAGTPTDCYSCHQSNFESTGDPNHVQANFSHACTDCHTTSGWSPANFSHAGTGFPLTGAHVSASCVSCHSAGYVNTPTDCYSCHQTDFTGVTNPNHVTNSFDHNCTTCHSTTTWNPSTFNHSSTSFPLTGAHISASCISCHSAGYVNTPTDCYSCHQSDFTGVTDPNHVTNNFDHNCTTCHTTTAWDPANFNHSSTSFPLTGAHISASCISCHSAGYVNTPTACYSCHQSDFTGVTDPNHVTNNFDHNCATCHSTTAWDPATFNHSSTSFPLTGAHTTATCIACHATTYSGTPTNCFACHQTDYQGTTGPNHTAASFPTTCQTCHTTSGWSPANWNHDSQYFPITTGTHASVWGNDCTTCHVSPSSYAVFECILCHEHSDQNKVNADHQGENGYRYLSTACYECHPRGRH